MRWNYSPIPKLQRGNRWRFKMDKLFHSFTEHVITCHSNLISKMSPCSQFFKLVNDFELNTVLKIGILGYEYNTKASLSTVTYHLCWELFNTWHNHFSPIPSPSCKCVRIYKVPLIHEYFIRLAIIGCYNDDVSMVKCTQHHAAQQSTIRA